MVLITIWSVTMGWHLLIKKRSPRSWLFFCGLGHFYSLLLQRQQSSNSAQAVCGGLEDGFNPSFLSNRMEDGCMETSSPFPAEPCGFCARAECWFSDPTFSFLPHGGLMEFKNQTNLFFFSPIYCNQWVNCLSFSSASDNLACFVYSHICFRMMLHQKGS